MTFSFTFFLLFSVLHFFLCGQSSGSSHMWDFFSCFFKKKKQQTAQKWHWTQQKKTNTHLCLCSFFSFCILCVSCFYLSLWYRSWDVFLAATHHSVLFLFSQKSLKSYLYYHKWSKLFIAVWFDIYHFFFISSYFYLPIPYFLKRRSKNDWIVA